MRTKLLATLMAALPVVSTQAMEGHGQEVYHRFDAEVATGVNAHGDQRTEWELDGWIGTSYDKLWIKSHGEKAVGDTEHADVWAMYSKNVDTFWDLQVGIRQEIEPEALSHIVLGVDGLAPFFVETSAHMFVSEDGDVSAQLKLDKEFLITQRLHVEPSFTAVAYAQDVDEKHVGAGLSQVKTGVKAKYEITRHVVPFVGLEYARKVGETSSIAKQHGEKPHETTVKAGLKLMF